MTNPHSDLSFDLQAAVSGETWLPLYEELSNLDVVGIPTQADLADASAWDAEELVIVHAMADRYEWSDEDRTNASTVFLFVLGYGSTPTRAEVFDEAGLTAPATSAAIEVLLDAGLIEETAGEPTMGLDFEDTYPVAYGIPEIE